MTTNLNSDLANGTQISDPSGSPFQLSQAFTHANQNDILISHPANASMKTGTWSYQVVNTSQTKLTLQGTVNQALTTEDTVTLDGSGVHYDLDVNADANDTEIIIAHGNNTPPLVIIKLIYINMIMLLTLYQVQVLHPPQKVMF